MRKVVLCFFIKRKRVLLAKKRRGRKPGRYSGYGGGVEPGESILVAIIREIFEESGLVVSDFHLKEVAVITTIRAKKKAFELHIFICSKWSGTPQDSDEMYDATWFRFNGLPKKMRRTERKWLRRVLAGALFGAKIIGSKNKKTITYTRSPRHHPYEGARA